MINFLAKEADVLELEDEIHNRAQSEVDRTQREFYLREQMKVIQTELGEADPWATEIVELRTRVEVGRLTGRGAGACAQRSGTPRSDAADVARGRHAADLRRVDPGAAVDQCDRG